MIEIIGIPALKDNYIWLLHNPKTQYAAVIDPGEAQPILTVLQNKNLQLRAILLTHRHADHCAGVPQLLEQVSAHISIPVYGSKNEATPYCTHPIAEGDSIELNDLNLSLRVLDIPGHTLGHIAYVGGDKDEKMLFCGDTLFTGGCGRVFEGTSEMMVQSLAKLKALPEDTLIYCGHEYTLANLRFALTIEPNNQDLQQRFLATQALRESGLPTVPSTLQIELKTNPFLRIDTPEVILAAERGFGQKLTKTPDIFSIIREMKNNFVG